MSGLVFLQVLLLGGMFVQPEPLRHTTSTREVVRFTGPSGVLNDYQGMRVFWNNQDQNLVKWVGNKLIIQEHGTYTFSTRIEFSGVGSGGYYSGSASLTGFRYVSLYFLRDRYWYSAVRMRYRAQSGKVTSVQIPFDRDGWHLDPGDEVVIAIYNQGSEVPVEYFPLYFSVVKLK